MAWWQKKLTALSDMWASDKKYVIFGLFVVCLYFMWMDVALYNSIQSLPPNLPHKSTTSTILDHAAVSSVAQPSFTPRLQLYSPFSNLNIKIVMLDPGNHYIHTPLCVMFNKITNFSKTWYFVTPNMITVFHFLVAALSGKLVTSESLTTRRLAVLLFEFRTWLDALDGLVYRARLSPSESANKSRAHPTSLGYYLDGFSDILGTTAFMVGCLIYLRKWLTRKANSHHLPLNSKITSEHSENGTSYYTNNNVISTRKIFFVLCCFGGQLMLSLIFWDRYVFAFQELLESPVSTAQMAISQNTVMKSALMWNVMWFWRMANAHALTEMLLVAVFLDKLWEFVLAVQYLGFVALFALISVTEIQLSSVKSYLRQS